MAKKVEEAEARKSETRAIGDKITELDEAVAELLADPDAVLVPQRAALELHRDSRLLDVGAEHLPRGIGIHVANAPHEPFPNAIDLFRVIRISIFY